MSRTARVSVVLPAYDSHSTIGRSLDCIASQTFRDFETIVVDSGPSEETARLLPANYSWVHYVRSRTRLLPQAALSRGVQDARGELLVFVDPDIYPQPEWLERMVGAHDTHGQVVVGAFECHGSNLFDRGVHLCKFSKWLPGGTRRAVDMSPSGNMLISRRDFDTVGGFAGNRFLDDVILSRALLRSGTRLMFEPGAVVSHHHEQTFWSFLGERFRRGIIFGELRSGWLDNPLSVGGYLAVTLAPVRLARVAMLVARDASRGGLSRWAAAYPLALTGHVASLAGEAVAYGRCLLRSGARRKVPASSKSDTSD